MAEDSVPAHPVDLVDHHQQGRGARLLVLAAGGPQLRAQGGGTGHRPDPVGRLGEDHPVARAHRAAGLDHGQHDVDVVQRRGGRLVHALPQRGPGLVQARRVDEHHLGVGPVEDAAHLGPGGVGPGRGDARPWCRPWR